jgi:hypothetical protein
MHANTSAIIRFFASYLLLLMPLGVPGLKRVFAVIFLLALCGSFVSCSNNGYGTPSTPSTTVSNPKVPSKLGFRAFVSNPLSTTSLGTISPALNIVDASADVLSPSTVDLSSLPNAGMMALSPSKAFTLVLNDTSNSVAIVDNTNEAVQSTVNLPGTTKSMFVWTDNQTGYAAIPNAPVSTGQGSSPGTVVAMNLPQSVVSATIPVAGAQYIVDSHNGSRILTFGSNPQAVTIISPSQIGTSTDPRTAVLSASFDHPVWGIFSADDTIAYILNCGPECGGAVASVAVLDMTQSPPQVSGTIAVPAATYGILNGSTLYVAGTSAGAGALTVIGVGSNSVLNAAPIAISDGYHNRMAISSNGELFIGAQTCSAGCLSIFNPTKSSIVIPPANGNVTGIQPITGRNVVYVCQNGVLNIYNTTTNALQTTQVDIVGQAVDVELVDSP